MLSHQIHCSREEHMKTVVLIHKIPSDTECHKVTSQDTNHLMSLRDCLKEMAAQRKSKSYMTC